MTSGTEEEKVYIHFFFWTRKTRNKFGEKNIFFCDRKEKRRRTRRKMFEDRNYISFEQEN